MPQCVSLHMSCIVVVSVCHYALVSLCVSVCMCVSLLFVLRFMFSLCVHCLSLCVSCCFCFVVFHIVLCDFVGIFVCVVILLVWFIFV